ncbi:MAG: glycine betaine ABC transporter substrate-binding protein [Polyangiaceae bacterium]
MRRVGAALVVLLLVLLPAEAWADRIAIGSKVFTESRLLAEIMAQLVEQRTDLEVERRFGLGGTQICFGALESGHIDLYPEYTGTAWAVILHHTDAVRDPLRAFLVSDRELRKAHALTWLSPFGFNNSYALAITRTTAERLKATRISDLAPHSGELRAGLSHEFLQREDGFPGLRSAYGLSLAEVRGMEHGLAYEALKTGAIDIVDTYTTDGKLLGYDVTVLEDDRRFFPPYDAAPLARAATLERHPELVPLFAELGFRIDDARMRTLNHEAEASGGDFAGVAARFLAAEGLAEKAIAAAPVRTKPEGFGDYLWQRRGKILELVLQHLELTLIAVLLAVFLSLPVGIYLSRHKRLAPFVIGGVGILQTIPSLALLAFMIPIPGLGLGKTSAVAALFLYALLPIVRNTFTGIENVDPHLVEAARAIGLTDRQILRHVELPLATRTIMAGIRTATVISLGVATLAAFVGAGGLGEPILTGLQLDDSHMILSGALPAALLAILADAALGRLERALAPVGA